MQIENCKLQSKHLKMKCPKQYRKPLKELQIENLKLQGAK